jgi:hypothetical protein
MEEDVVEKPFGPDPLAVGQFFRAHFAVLDSAVEATPGVPSIHFVELASGEVVADGVANGDGHETDVVLRSRKCGAFVLVAVCPIADPF